MRVQQALSATELSPQPSLPRVFFIVVVVVVVVGDPFASFFSRSGYQPFGMCNLPVFPHLLLSHFSLR